MLNKRTAFCLMLLSLSVGVVSANAMEPEYYPIKQEPGLSMKSVYKAPHSIEYVKSKIANINPGYDARAGIRNKGCLPVSIKGYEFLSQQLEEPEIAEDHIPTAPNISLRNIGRLLPTDHYVPSTPNFEQVDEEVHIYEAPQGLTIELDVNYYREVRFAKVKYNKNQFKDVLKFEDYIQKRIAELKVSPYGFLAGLIYLDNRKNQKGAYSGHFVDFYTLLNGTSYNTYICDFLTHEVWSLNDYMDTHCGENKAFRNQFYVWSGEKYQEYKNPIVKAEKAPSKKRPSEEQNLNVQFKKSRAGDISQSSTEEESLDMDAQENQDSFVMMGSHIVNQNYPSNSYLNYVPSFGNQHTYGTQVTLPLAQMGSSGTQYHSYPPMNRSIEPSQYGPVNGTQAIVQNNQPYGFGYAEQRPPLMQHLALPQNDLISSAAVVQRVIVQAKSESWQERGTAGMALVYGVQNNAPWAMVLYQGMENNAPWAEEKLAVWSKSQGWQERDTAGIAIFDGNQNNAPWAREKFDLWAKSEDGKERATAGEAICNGMQKQAPWAQKMLAVWAQSENSKERETGAKVIELGMRQRAKWAQEILAVLEKSENAKERLMAARVLTIGINNQATWTQEKLVALTKGEDINERDMTARAIVQEQPSVADHQTSSSSSQDTIDYKFLYLEQQKTLQDALQQIERLKLELALERATQKG
jgi:hypothetical protein